MRALDPEFQARLDGGSTTLCRCWRLVRRDGVVMGFTDHDRDLEFAGAVFRASTGMTAAALRQSTGLSVDNSEVAGALQAAGLTEADIAAGRYDGAAIRHWLVDWTDPALRVLLFSGTLGEISRGAAGFQVELRGVSEDLNRTVGRSYLRSCDAVLGDARCGVDTGSAAVSGEGVVVSVTANRQMQVSGLAHAPRWFERGALTWLSGANAGDVVQVRADVGQGTARVVQLWEQAAGPVLPGDRFRIVAGCPKTAAACRGKFNNFINFRGFPYLPGEDWVTGYVKDGETHDGGSLYR